MSEAGERLLKAAGEMRAMSEIPAEIKALRLEARRLNAKSKKKVAASGGAWLLMDEEDEVDFRRYLNIQAEIERLKRLAP